MATSLLCETVTGRTMAELLAARDNATHGDMVELRLDGVAGLDVAPVVVVGCIMLLYLLLSSVMDELAMIVLTIPILFPLVMELDLYGLSGTEKAIWFGILVLSVVEIGLIAPPVGLNVYVVNSLAPDVPMSETYKGVAVFLTADFVRITLVLAFPGLSLWLMRLIS